MATDPRDTHRPTRPTGWGRTLTLGFAAALALLIWVRLRIVAQVPRSVLADPEARMVEPPRSGPARSP